MNDIFDENGFSKINSIGTMHGYDPITKAYTETFQHPLVKGCTVPANATMVEPIEHPKGINRWVDGKWIDDVDFYNAIKIATRKEKIILLQNEASSRLTKLTLKQSVGRITEAEDELRVRIINYLIDLDEFPIEDLSKELPVLLHI